jgi:hypothetical protein
MPCPVPSSLPFRKSLAHMRSDEGLLPDGLTLIQYLSWLPHVQCTHEMQLFGPQKAILLPQLHVAQSIKLLVPLDTL